MLTKELPCRRRWPRKCLFSAVGFSLLLTAGCQNPFGPKQPVDPMASMRPLDTIGEGSKLSKPQMADFNYAKGRSLEESGDFEGALAAYHESVRLNPARIDAQMKIGILHDRMGKFDQSAEYYRKALEMQPGNPDVYCNMGYSMYVQGRYPEAEMNLRQAVTLKPTHARAHNNLGMVCVRTGRVDEAMAEFHKGGCRLCEAHTNVAFALTTQRQWDQARKHYELALVDDPDSATAKEGLTELNSIASKVQKSDAILAQHDATQGDKNAQVAVSTPAKPAAKPAPRAMGQVAMPAPKLVPARGAVLPDNRVVATPSPTPAPRVSPASPGQYAAAQPQPSAAPTRPRPQDGATPRAIPVSRPLTTRLPAVDEDEPAVPSPAMVPMRETAAIQAVPQLPEKRPSPALSQPTGIQPAPASSPVFHLAQPVAKPPVAPRLSFSPGALHRDRYLEEQSDPEAQQTSWSTSKEDPAR